MLPAVVTFSISIATFAFRSPIWSYFYEQSKKAIANIFVIYNSSHLFNAFTNIYNFFFLTETIFKTFGTKKTQFVPTDIHCSDLLSFLRLLYWQLTFVEVDCNKNSDHHFYIKTIHRAAAVKWAFFFLNLKCLLLQMLASIPRASLSVFCIH